MTYIYIYIYVIYVYIIFLIYSDFLHVLCEGAMVRVRVDYELSEEFDIKVIMPQVSSCSCGRCRH